MVLTVCREVIRVLRRGASSLQLGRRCGAGSDGVGSKEGVQMRLAVLAGKHDRVDILVHEHVNIDVGVSSDLRHQSEDNLATHSGQCRNERTNGKEERLKGVQRTAARRTFQSSKKVGHEPAYVVEMGVQLVGR